MDDDDDCYDDGCCKVGGGCYNDGGCHNTDINCSFDKNSYGVENAMVIVLMAIMSYCLLVNIFTWVSDKKQA